MATLTMRALRRPRAWYTQARRRLRRGAERQGPAEIRVAVEPMDGPRYDTDVDLSNRNNSHTLMVELVGGTKRVLDVGCATGYLARGPGRAGLHRLGRGVRPERGRGGPPPPRDGSSSATWRRWTWPRRSATTASTSSSSATSSSTCATRWRCCARPGRCWPTGGSVVASIPNIAHGSVRLALLAGRFDYQDARPARQHPHAVLHPVVDRGRCSARPGMVPIDVRRTTAGFFDTPLPVARERVPARGRRRGAGRPRVADLPVRAAGRARRRRRCGRPPAGRCRGPARPHRRARARRWLAAPEAPCRRARAAAEDADKRADDLEHRLAGTVEELGRRCGPRSWPECGPNWRSVLATRTMRWTRQAREAYGRLRRLRAAISMADAAIVVDGVSKRFRLYHERNRSLKAAVLRGGRARYEEFWALRDVSLEIEEGKTYGLVGRERLGQVHPAQVHRPDPPPGRRHASARGGKMAALLELGSGFHPELSGRENVFLNGSILGLSKRDLTARFDEIVGFAGLERFIDQPVKNYSSGMYVRLGFSVAINVDPDVLLVDEVLAVGDAVFQRRCHEKFADFRGPARRWSWSATPPRPCARCATRWRGSRTAKWSPRAGRRTSSTTTSTRATRTGWRPAERPEPVGFGRGPARARSSSSTPAGSRRRCPPPATRHLPDALAGRPAGGQARVRPGHRDARRHVAVGPPHPRRRLRARRDRRRRHGRAADRPA